MIGKVEPCKLDAVVEVIDTDGMLCPKKKSEQKNKKNKATNLYQEPFLEKNIKYFKKSDRKQGMAIWKIKNMRKEFQ